MEKRTGGINTERDSVYVVCVCVCVCVCVSVCVEGVEVLRAQMWSQAILVHIIGFI